MEPFKSCKKCNKFFPSYMIEDYSYLHPSPLCPICALELRNRLYRKTPGSPFSDLDQQDLWEEARGFLLRQCRNNWGGHMINPPEECKWRFKVPDGGEWTDLGCCLRSCKDRCTRYFQYCRMSETERRDELLDNGIMKV